MKKHKINYLKKALICIRDASSIVAIFFSLFGLAFGKENSITQNLIYAAVGLAILAVILTFVIKGIANAEQRVEQRIMEQFSEEFFKYPDDIIGKTRIHHSVKIFGIAPEDTDTTTLHLITDGGIISVKTTGKLATECNKTLNKGDTISIIFFDENGTNTAQHLMLHAGLSSMMI